MSPLSGGEYFSESHMHVMFRSGWKHTEGIFSEGGWDLSDSSGTGLVPICLSMLGQYVVTGGGSFCRLRVF